MYVKGREFGRGMGSILGLGVRVRGCMVKVGRFGWKMGRIFRVRGLSQGIYSKGRDYGRGIGSFLGLRDRVRGCMLRVGNSGGEWGAFRVGVGFRGCMVRVERFGGKMGCFFRVRGQGSKMGEITTSKAAEEIK